MIDRFCDTPVGLLLLTIASGATVAYFSYIAYCMLAAVLDFLTHLCRC